MSRACFLFLFLGLLGRDALVAAGDRMPIGAARPSSAPQEDEDATGGRRLADERDPLDETRQQAQVLIAAGLSALAEARNADGSVGGLDTERVRIAVTALALLAFVADGNFEDRGPHAEVVRGATRFLIGCSKRDGDRRGYFETAGDIESRMHGQGFATLALCQVYGHHGVTRRYAGTAAELRQVIRDAVDLILRAQNSAGGWFYEPFASVEDEGSITVTMIQALRAARNVGIAVPKSAIDRALDYVKASQNEDGSVRYSLRNQREGSFELTAAALGVLAYGGEYDSRNVRAARDWLWGRESIYAENVLSYPLYGFFYAMQALWFDYDVDRVRKYYPPFVVWCREHWNAKERHYEMIGGARLKENEYGPDYAAAMLTLSLQVPLWSLPIFDR
ncbi:MAG: terpene cyclase/mutase family protein [Planctomycetes bacterium]|nr:terpene cyclase/mutase family protein [Planctomycetota bacterium]